MFEGKQKEIVLEAGIIVLINFIFKRIHKGTVLRALMEILKIINDSLFNLEITQQIFRLPLESRLIPNVVIYLVQYKLLDISEFDKLSAIDFEKKQLLPQVQQLINVIKFVIENNKEDLSKLTNIIGLARQHSHLLLDQEDYAKFLKYLDQNIGNNYKKIIQKQKQFK